MLTYKDYQRAADSLGVSVAHIKAFSEVESSGYGFLPTGEVKILFERHIFYRQLTSNKGKAFADTVSKTDSDICNTTPGGYGKLSSQHHKLQRAVAIDRKSALESCSWGAFQVMGFHWKSLGYDSVQSLVNAAYSDQGQLELVIQFLKGNPKIVAALKQNDWETVARLYNGPGFAANSYHTKMRDAFIRFGGKL
jgi:hypothetical protein